jgi:hypothetical protein
MRQERPEPQAQHAEPMAIGVTEAHRIATSVSRFFRQNHSFG